MVPVLLVSPVLPVPPVPPAWSFLSVQVMSCLYNRGFANIEVPQSVSHWASQCVFDCCSLRSSALRQEQRCILFCRLSTTHLSLLWLLEDLWCLCCWSCLCLRCHLHHANTFPVNARQDL